MVFSMSLLRAFRNLALTARRNPVWAIGAAAMSPLALLRHLFGVAVLFIVTGLVLSIAVKLGLAQLGIGKGSILYTAGMVAVAVASCLVGLRALFLPLLHRYGGTVGDDTHGSARFASRSETRPLACSDGLLIGRDPASGARCATPALRTC
jgi:type IV secretion system protein VirD4